MGYSYRILKVPLCELCLEADHKGHITSSLDLVPSHVKSLLPSMVESCTAKQKELRELMKSLHGFLSDLSVSRGKNKDRIQETYNQWRIALDTVKVRSR